MIKIIESEKASLIGGLIGILFAVLGAGMVGLVVLLVCGLVFIIKLLRIPTWFVVGTGIFLAASLLLLTIWFLCKIGKEMHEMNEIRKRCG